MSIELPDGTIHRNIQEQVAQNMKDIAALTAAYGDLPEILPDINSNWDSVKNYVYSIKDYLIYDEDNDIININSSLKVSGDLENDGFLKPAEAANQLDLDLILSTTTAFDEKATLTQGFCHARISNGKLSIVANFSYIPVSGATTGTLYNAIRSSLIPLSDEIMNKLIPVSGIIVRAGESPFSRGDAAYNGGVGYWRITKQTGGIQLTYNVNLTQISEGITYMCSSEINFTL